jgi:hypothetical protein
VNNSVITELFGINKRIGKPDFSFFIDLNIKIRINFPYEVVCGFNFLFAKGKKQNGGGREGEVPTVGRGTGPPPSSTPPVYVKTSW